MNFYEVLDQIIDLLRSRQRVAYRALKRQFDIDDDYLEDLKEALLFGYPQIIEEDGRGLVWAEDAQKTQPSLAHNIPPQQVEAPPTLPRTRKAERRQLTVMFCDLADSTKLSQQLDPEDLRDVIRAYQETAAGIIHQFAGHIAQYLGDGLLVYFGWPTAHEDDAQRTLHAGLGIVDAITTTLNPRLEREKEVRLAVRLGIHTGPVVVGEMGGGGRHESLATGETVNIASRLEGLGALNTVMISNVTARLVQNAFDLEDLGAHELKGVEEPMVAFRVLGPMETREDDEHAPSGAPFLVGRDEEMGLMLRRWQQSKEGLGQVVMVSGEAGIGKSSLVSMVRNHVGYEECTRITFRCSPYHQSSALYPVITHLERVLDFDTDDSSVIKIDKLEHVLRATNLPVGEAVPMVAALLSVPLDDRYPVSMLSPQQQRQQTLDTLVEWLLEEAGHQPALVVWEDLQWADPSTLEMLGLVLEQTPTVPMLSVLTFRPEFELPWSIRSHMTPISLNRLERLQVEALIMHLSGGKALPDEVIEHIVAKTDGVPLYVEELTKMLLASNFLRQDREQYVLTEPLLTVAIPDTLQDSLMARLDQLNTAKEVLQLGAVLGREFAYEMLQAVSPQDEETLQAGLSQLVDAELLYRRGRPPRARYIFKHALIQDAAYQSLLKSTRQQLHQEIAQMLEVQFPEMVETQPELLAHHYTEARCGEQAVRHWYAAGDRAVQRSAYVEAEAHLKRGLKEIGSLPDTAERTRQELTLLMVLGPVLIATKGYSASEVKGTFTQAKALCDQMNDSSNLFPVLRGLWNSYLCGAEMLNAREYGQQLLDLAQSNNDASRLIEAHRVLATAAFFIGDFLTARAQAEQGIALYDPEQHDSLAFVYGANPSVVCTLYLALSLWMLGYPEQAQTKMDHAIASVQELTHGHSEAFALSYQSFHYQYRREVQAVLKWSESAIAVASKHGSRQWLSWSTIVRGWALAMAEQWERGVRELREELEAWRAGGQMEWVVTYFLGLMAEVLALKGQIKDALDVLTEALKMSAKNAEGFYEAELYRLKGECLLHQTDPNTSQATTCFQKALDIARHQQAKSWELRAATSLARLWQSQDKRQDACDLLAPVYNWFTEGFDTADLQEAKALLDQLKDWPRAGLVKAGSLSSKG